jgi:hypothetical protein
MSAVYNDMLNDHLHYDLLKAELNVKNYLWKTLEHDEGATGDIIVPFQKQKATSVKLGAGPSASTDISQHKYTRGSLAQADRPKIWGSLKFDYEDIFHHDGRMKQKSFLGTFLPKQIQDFTTYFSQTVNHGFLNSEHLDKTAGTGSTAGVIAVNRIERFEVDQKINDGSTDYYVTAVNVNTDEITLSATRGGSGADISAIVADTELYQDGFDTGNRLSNLKSLLLSDANGGSANIYGVSKLASSFTQAINVSGASMTANNVLEKIFDAISVYRRKAKGGLVECWMSYKHFGQVMKTLEQDKGPYKAMPGSTKSSEYGFTEITIFGAETGAIKFVALPEMDDDVIVLANPKSMKIHSNKGINKVKSPDGNFYVVDRSASTGYSFITDMLFEGDIIVSQPSENLIIYDIDYAIS